MAQREIKISLAEAKMEALEFFLKENDVTVEALLSAHLDKVYEKHVPQQVRKFLESKMEPEVNVQESAPAEEGNRRVNRRNARQDRNREQATSTVQAEENLNVQEQETVQEENAGMSMSM